MKREELQDKINGAEIEALFWRHQKDLVDLLEQSNGSLAMAILDENGLVTKWINVGTFGDPEFEQQLRELLQEWITGSMREEFER